MQDSQGGYYNYYNKENASGSNEACNNNSQSQTDNEECEFIASCFRRVGTSVQCGFEKVGEVSSFIQGSILNFIPHIVPLTATECRSFALLLRKILSGSVLFQRMDF